MLQYTIRKLDIKVSLKKITMNSREIILQSWITKAMFLKLPAIVDLS
jgi:hypothetical protein